VLRPKINIKRRITLDSKVAGAFFVSFIITAVGVIFACSSFSSPHTSAGAPGGDMGSSLVLGTQGLLPSQPVPTPSPTPFQTSTPASTPIPTSISTPVPDSTNAPQTSQPLDSNESSESPPVGNYSGPALEPASEKKDLLLLSDSLPDGWEVEKSEGVDFIPGKIGKALSLAPGSLVLSGGKTFANAGTLSFWLKLENEPISEESPLMDWNFEGGDYSPSLFEISVVEDRLLFSIYDEEGNQDDINGQLKLPLEWHFVVVTWDLTKEPYERVLYIDGKKIAAAGFPFAPMTHDLSIFQIGGTLGARNPVSFIIDELVLINWAKSESEVVQ
jgi:hypothetical protein